MDPNDPTPTVPSVETGVPAAVWLPTAMIMLLLAAVMVAVALWRYRKGAVGSMSVCGGVALLALAGACGIASLGFAWLELFRWVFGLAGIALLVYALPPVRRFVDGHAPFMRQLMERRTLVSPASVTAPRPPEPPGARA